MKIVKLTTALLLAGACTIASAASTTFTNGDFDFDLSGWTNETPAVGGTGVTWSAGTAHLGRPGTPGIAIFTQTFTVSPDTLQISFAFDYEWQVTKPSINDEFFAKLELKLTDGSTASIAFNQNSDDGDFNVTKAFSSNFDIALAGTTTLDAVDNAKITFELDENNSPVGTRVQLDNVVVSAVPEPATVALLLAGLTGLGVARRRR